jgi:hypothetical protein
MTLLVRRREPELMDQPDLASPAHDAALAGLERINRWSAAEAALRKPVLELARRVRDEGGPPLTLLDVACGGGDVPLALWADARRERLPLDVAAIDRSPQAVAHAQAAAGRRGASVRIWTRDACDGRPLPQADVVTCSLFLHHLEPEAAVALLSALGAATHRLLLVADLRRTLTGLLLAQDRAAAAQPLARGPCRRAGLGARGVVAGRAGRDGRARRPARGARAADLPPAHAVVVDALTTVLSLEAAAARTWDALVVGAGPAGSLAALELARAGRSVLVVERASFPRDKACGGCLNATALAALRASGLGALPAEAGARPLARVCLHAGGRVARLPLRGSLALSRASLDAALLEAARGAGAAVLFETRAASDTSGASLDDVRTVPLSRDGEGEVRVAARVVLVAAGLGATLLDGPVARPARGSRIGAGTVLEGAGAALPPGELHMACGARGYVGLVAAERGRLVVAAALDAAAVAEAGGLGRAAAAIVARAGCRPSRVWPRRAGSARRRSPARPPRSPRAAPSCSATPRASSSPSPARVWPGR